MAAKKSKATRWVPVLWQRQYRDVAIWVEEVYSASPKWEWNAEWGNGGRARSKAEAMQKAKRYVDRALKAARSGESARSKP